MAEPKPMPRLFLVRHGETEWTRSGYVPVLQFLAYYFFLLRINVLARRRHTGRSDIPLLPEGEEAIKTCEPVLVGQGKLLDPGNICHAFVSPRIRSRRTFELLFANVPSPPPHTVTEEVREWDYGDYEGLTANEIKQKDRYWSIWRTGCPGGESAEEMTKRVDAVIDQVQEYHRRYFEEGIGKRDVLIVSHGHFSRVMIARWVQFPMSLGTHFNFEPAGIAILSYNHRNLKEPALNALNLNADHKIH
ncbi:hypothetical protein ACEPAH_734 [Sanghuangporus vaninii]